MSGSLAAAFLPWLLFTVVARTGGLGLGWAALAALGAAAIVAVVSHHRRSWRGFELASIAVFAVLGALDLLASPLWPSIGAYGRGLAEGGLALVALGSAAIRRPFTAAYTREAVSPGVAADEMFLRANTLCSTVWGFCALGAAGSYTADALSKAATTTTIFNWLVPLALALCGVWCSLRQWRALTGEEDDGDDLVLLASLTTTPTVRRAAPPQVMAPRTRGHAASNGVASNGAVSNGAGTNGSRAPMRPLAPQRRPGLRAVRDDVHADPGAGR